MLAKVGEQCVVTLDDGSMLAGRLVNDRRGWFEIETESGQRYRFDYAVNLIGDVWVQPDRMKPAALGRPSRFDPDADCLY